MKTNGAPKPDDFTGEFYRTFKKELTPVLHNLFQKIEREKTFPNSFYEDSITLIWNQIMASGFVSDEERWRRWQTNKEDGRLISLMNMGEKILNKILANRASLVVQWLRICLLMQGTRVRVLVWEDPTCRGATRPVSHNCWACASGACALQQERPR